MRPAERITAPHLRLGIVKMARDVSHARRPEPLGAAEQRTDLAATRPLGFRHSALHDPAAAPRRRRAILLRSRASHRRTAAKTAAGSRGSSWSRSLSDPEPGQIRIVAHGTLQARDEAVSELPPSRRRQAPSHCPPAEYRIARHATPVSRLRQRERPVARKNWSDRDNRAAVEQRGQCALRDRRWHAPRAGQAVPARGACGRAPANREIVRRQSSAAPTCPAAHKRSPAAAAIGRPAPTAPWPATPGADRFVGQRTMRAPTSAAA